MEKDNQVPSDGTKEETYPKEVGRRVSSRTIEVAPGQYRYAIFDRVTGLWSDDERYWEPGGSGGDAR